MVPEPCRPYIHPHLPGQLRRAETGTSWRISRLPRLNQPGPVGERHGAGRKSPRWPRFPSCRRSARRKSLGGAVGFPPGRARPAARAAGSLAGAVKDRKRPRLLAASGVRRWRRGAARRAAFPARREAIGGSHRARHPAAKVSAGSEPRSLAGHASRLAARPANARRNCRDRRRAFRAGAVVNSRRRRRSDRPAAGAQWESAAGRTAPASWAGTGDPLRRGDAGSTRSSVWAGPAPAPPLPAPVSPGQRPRSTYPVRSERAGRAGPAGDSAGHCERTGRVWPAPGPV